MKGDVVRRLIAFMSVDDMKEYWDAVADVAKQRPLAKPFVFVGGNAVGGVEETLAAHADGRLGALLGVLPQNEHGGDTLHYDYDLIVVGGGSGGLACSKVIALMCI